MTEQESNAKLYAGRDPRTLEPHFSRHMLAMTAESLHSKVAIAEELAFRDAEIDHLLEENAEYQGENAALRRLRKELSAEIRGVRDENEMLRCRGRHLIAEVRRDWNLGRVSVDAIQAARQLEAILSAQSDDTPD